MESKEIKFDCQLAYESLLSFITNNNIFINEYLIIQIDLREDKSISTKQFNIIVDILEQINSIVLADLTDARKHYYLLKTRTDIDFNRHSEEEILNIWKGEKNV